MQPVVVLNSPEAADELLVKRAKNYSERPYAHVASELLSDGQRMLLMPYDEPWKVRHITMHYVVIDRYQ